MCIETEYRIKERRNTSSNTYILNTAIKLFHSRVFFYPEQRNDGYI